MHNFQNYVFEQLELGCTNQWLRRLAAGGDAGLEYFLRAVVLLAKVAALVFSFSRTFGRPLLEMSQNQDLACRAGGFDSCGGAPVQHILVSINEAGKGDERCA